MMIRDATRMKRRDQSAVWIASIGPKSDALGLGKCLLDLRKAAGNWHQIDRHSGLPHYLRVR